MWQKIKLIFLNILQSTDLDNLYFEKVVWKYIHPQLEKNIKNVKNIIEKYIPIYIIKSLNLYGYKDFLVENITAKKICNILIQEYNKKF